MPSKFTLFGKKPFFVNEISSCSFPNLIRFVKTNSTYSYPLSGIEIGQIPISDFGSFFYISNSDTLVAALLSNGSTIWNFKSEDVLFPSFPVLYNDSLYITGITKDFVVTLFCLSIETGNENWNFTITSTPSSRPISDVSRETTISQYICKLISKKNRNRS